MEDVITFLTKVTLLSICLPVSQERGSCRNSGIPVVLPCTRGWCDECGLRGCRETVGSREDDTSSLFHWRYVHRHLLYSRTSAPVLSVFSFCSRGEKNPCWQPSRPTPAPGRDRAGLLAAALGGGHGSGRCRRQGCPTFPQPYRPSMGDTDEVNFDVMDLPLISCS